jgi:tRNA pseudouridine55 synthase
VTSGLVIVDKSAGMTSHDVVSRMRRLAHTRRVGHAGTLDPMATGVLVLGVEKATRLLTHLVLTDKAYSATIRLGRSTVSDDAQGAALSDRDASGVADHEVLTAMTALTGQISQRPSAVSAIRVDGQRAYARVRAGEDVVLAERAVQVTRFDAIDVRREIGPSGLPIVDVDVEVECSSGTYVRALARDLGDALEVGGHLTALRRTRVGPFDISAARTLDQLADLEDPVLLALPDAIRAAMAVREIDDKEAASLSYGQFLVPRGIGGVHGAITAEGRAVALLREDGEHSRPVLVFSPA